MIESPIKFTQVLSNQENLLELARRVNHEIRPVKNPKNKYRLTSEQYSSYFKFSFVRNPWARAYSWYSNVIRDERHMKNYHIDKNISFDNFIDRFAGKKLLKPQTYWLKSFDGAISMDYVGRFESLGEGFSMVSEILGLDAVDLPHSIKGSGKDYREFYSNKSKEVIRNIYNDEIKLFNYSFD